MNLVTKIRHGLHIINSILWLDEQRWPCFVFVEQQRADIRALGFGGEVIVVTKDELEHVQAILTNPLSEESKAMLANLMSHERARRAAEVEKVIEAGAIARHEKANAQFTNEDK